MADDIRRQSHLTFDQPEKEIAYTYLGQLRHDYRDFIAEFWGTFIFIIFGDGVVVQTVLSHQNNGNWTTINICWGVAVILGIYTAGGISGAHLNPAVTLTLAIFRQFPWKKVPGYMFVQGTGAAFAALILYANYIQAFNAYDNGIRSADYINHSTTATADVFATYPAQHLTSEGAFFDQFLGTTLLVFCIFAINDMGNTGAGTLGPLMVGLLVIGIGMAFGWQTGYALNPARDLGPRLFSWLCYGGDVFTAGTKYFQNYSWIPVVAPLLGGPFGALLYDVFMYTGESPVKKYFQQTR